MKFDYVDHWWIYPSGRTQLMGYTQVRQGENFDQTLQRMLRCHIRGIAALPTHVVYREQLYRLFTEGTVRAIPVSDIDEQTDESTAQRIARVNMKHDLRVDQDEDYLMSAATYRVELDPISPYFDIRSWDAEMDAGAFAEYPPDFKLAPGDQTDIVEREWSDDSPTYRVTQ